MRGLNECVNDNFRMSNKTTFCISLSHWRNITVSYETHPFVYPVSCSYSLVSPICFLHSAHLYCCDDNPVSGQILKLYVVTDTCQEKRHERQYTLNIINLKPWSISNLGKFLRWFFITGKRFFLTKLRRRSSHVSKQLLDSAFEWSEELKQIGWNFQSQFCPYLSTSTGSTNQLQTAPMTAVTTSY